MTRKGTTRASTTPGAPHKLDQLLAAEADKLKPRSDLAVAAEDLPEHQRLLAAIKLGLEQWYGQGIMVCCVMAEAHVKAIWGKYQVAGEDDFWRDVAGIAPRTADRMIGIGTTIAKFPEADRPHVIAAFATIGIHKAEIIRPMLEAAITAASTTEAPAVIHWREWTEKAKDQNEDRLAEAVGEARGTRPRRSVGAGSTTGTGDNPGRQEGDPFLTYLVNHMPTDETRTLCREAFALGYRMAETDSTVGVLIAMCQECIGSWGTGPAVVIEHDTPGTVTGAAKTPPPPQSTTGDDDDGEAGVDQVHELEEGAELLRG